MNQICDWAKYHNRHSTKSKWVVKLSFCQNDPPMGKSFWLNKSLVTSTLFELCLFVLFSPASNLMHHPLCTQTLNSNSDGILILITLIRNLGHQSAACQGGQRIWRKQQSWGPHVKSTHPLWPQEIVRKIRGPSSHPSSIDQRPRTFRLGKGFWRMHSSVIFLIFIIY